MMHQLIMNTESTVTSARPRKRKNPFTALSHAGCSFCGASLFFFFAIYLSSLFTGIFCAESGLYKAHTIHYSKSDDYLVNCLLKIVKISGRGEAPQLYPRLCRGIYRACGAVMSALWASYVLPPQAAKFRCAAGRGTFL